MPRYKIDEQIDLTQWNWGEFDRAHESFFELLKAMEKSVAQDIAQIIQDTLNGKIRDDFNPDAETGILVTLESDGDIEVTVPLTNNKGEDVVVIAPLRELVDEFFEEGMTDADERKQIAAILRAQADRLDPPP